MRAASSAGAPPSPLLCCDVCGASPISDALAFRCAVCRVWACCEGCRSGQLDSSARWRAALLELHDGTHALSPTRTPAGAGDPPLHAGPLAAVVANAVQRWYAETLAAAKGGEPSSMELLAQMLAEGYGCPRDAALARFWHAAAHARGARRLEGVFDRLP